MKTDDPTSPTSPPDDFSQICFGLSRSIDEQSLPLFLERFANRKLLDVLVPRLKEQELHKIVELLSGLMKRHLSEAEYHRLFLSPRINRPAAHGKAADG